MALARIGSRRGAGPPGPRRSRRSRPSALRMAHTVWADTGWPSAPRISAISLTERLRAGPVHEVAAQRLVAALRWFPGLHEVLRPRPHTSGRLSERHAKIIESKLAEVVEPRTTR